MERPRSFFTGFNYYVVGMQAGTRLGAENEHLVEFGAPALAATDAVATGVDITTAGSTEVNGIADARYGRCPSITLDVVTDAETVITAKGYDYLGQPMVVDVTIASGAGTTTVVFLKAMYRITEIISDGASGTGTAEIGWANRLGLPYKTVDASVEIVDGDVKENLGTLFAPDVTDPATAVTLDPRGTYTPTTTLDGVTIISLYTIVSRAVNAANNGGLHGIRQAAS